MRDSMFILITFFVTFFLLAKEDDNREDYNLMGEDVR